MHQGHLFEPQQRGLCNGGDRGAYPPVRDVTFVPVHHDRRVTVDEARRNSDHVRGVSRYSASAAAKSSFEDFR